MRRIFDTAQVPRLAGITYPLFGGGGGALISGGINSPELQDARDEGYLVMRKPLDTARFRAVLASRAEK